MATPVEMPKLGNTVEDCLLSRWMKAAGDTVAAGEILAEIETDKATFEVPAPVGGVLLARFCEEGQIVPVFTNICAIGAPGEDVSGFRVSVGGTEARESVDAPPGGTEAPRVLKLAPQPPPAPSTGAGVASPRARRFAEEHRMTLDGIAGSGPGGRILEQDVRDAFHDAPRSGVAGRAPQPAAKTQSAGTIREKIARRMRESLASTAQYTMTASASATALLALRARIKARRPEVPDINVNDLVLFSVVKALGRMPQLNAEWKDGQIHEYDHIHLGFACDTDRGLMVPVIRDAQAMTIDQLAASAKDLADRAVKGRILPDELAGATFTVSNLGNLGIESFTPIINAPQVAILGVDSIEPRMVRRDGRIEVEDRIGLSLTCDHQVIDGAPGARFLGVVRDCIEDVQALAGLKV